MSVGGNRHQYVRVSGNSKDLNHGHDLVHITSEACEVKKLKARFLSRRGGAEDFIGLLEENYQDPYVNFAVEKEMILSKATRMRKYITLEELEIIVLVL